MPGARNHIDYVRVKDRVELDWDLPTPRYTFQVSEQLEDAVTQLVEMYNSALSGVVPMGVRQGSWLRKETSGNTKSCSNRRIKGGDILKVRRLRFDKKEFSSPESGYVRTWIDRNDGYFTRCLFMYDGQSARLHMIDYTSLVTIMKGVRDRERVEIPETVGDFALLSQEMQEYCPWCGIVLQIAQFGELEGGTIAERSGKDPLSMRAPFIGPEPKQETPAPQGPPNRDSRVRRKRFDFD